MILDTNALSALLDRDAALLKVIGRSRELSLPVIVLGEYRFGIAISKRRHEYEAWLARDLSLFRVLPVVEETSVHYAAIRLELKASGSPVPANDAWIAALARQHRLPIVSRDAHFDSIKNIERRTWANIERAHVRSSSPISNLESSSRPELRFYSSRSRWIRG